MAMMMCSTCNTLMSNHMWMCIECVESVFPFNHLDDDADFRSAVSNNISMTSEVTLDSLNDKIFNPFEDYDQDNGLPLIDVDPDLQFFNDINLANIQGMCDYFIEDTFMKKMSQLLLQRECFSLVHLNIRSMSKHLGEFTVYLHSLRHEFSVICLSETWLKDSNVGSLGIPGYNHECEYRSNKIGGGVSLLIKESIVYQSRHDLKVFNQCIESIFVEIPKEQIGVEKNVVIGVIYRPPNTDI